MFSLCMICIASIVLMFLYQCFFGWKDKPGVQIPKRTATFSSVVLVYGMESVVGLAIRVAYHSKTLTVFQHKCNIQYGGFLKF